MIANKVQTNLMPKLKKPTLRPDLIEQIRRDSALAGIISQKLGVSNFTVIYRWCATNSWKLAVPAVQDIIRIYLRLPKTEILTELKETA